MRVPEALESDIVPETFKRALREFWEWFEPRYSLDIEVEVWPPSTARIELRYDAEREIEGCTATCVKLYGDKVEGRTEKEVELGCYEACIEDIASSVNAAFHDALNKLEEVLREYGIKVVEEGCNWEGHEKWCRIEVRL
jgi:hypothetical protein